MAKATWEDASGGIRMDYLCLYVIAGAVLSG